MSSSFFSMLFYLFLFIECHSLSTLSYIYSLLCRHGFFYFQCQQFHNFFTSPPAPLLEDFYLDFLLFLIPRRSAANVQKLCNILSHLRKISSDKREQWKVVTAGSILSFCTVQCTLFFLQNLNYITCNVHYEAL